MQLVLIGLFITLFGYNALYETARAEARGWWTVAAVFAPKLMIAGVYWALCRRTLRKLGSSDSRRAYRRLDRVSVAYSLLLLPLFVLDIVAGGLELIRQGIGDLVLLDELVLVLPTLGMMVWGWVCYYPIDRSLREAILMRNIDQGNPVYPVWSRRQFVWSQIRHQVMLVLAPLLLIFSWSELVRWMGPGGLGWFDKAAQPWAVAAGAGAVFLLAPLVIRVVWDTTPLPAGEIRERLAGLCADYRVGVRELLLWRTYGGMANAAVLGLIRPLRYILLSDALLDRASAGEIEAVMAHELAHVKKQHMFWLLAAALGLAGTLEIGVYEALVEWTPAGAEPAWWHIALLAAPAFLIWGWAFGFISRRAERQADTFAVQHLASTTPHPSRDEHGRALVGREAVVTMVGALEQVARLNHIRPNRRNWRHGSIAWRQTYLKTLVGRPIQDMPIDRLMWAINIGALLLLGFTGWSVLR